MRSRLLLFVFCLSLVLVPVASADPLNFSFTFGGYGTGAFTNDNVTGEVFGLSNNATSSATAVFIDTAGNTDAQDILPYDTLHFYDVYGQESANLYQNSFTVVDGEVTSADFAANLGGYDRSEPNFNILILGESYSQLGFGEGPIYGFNLTFTPVTSVASTAEPAALNYMFEGLAACLVWRRMRQPK